MVEDLLNAGGVVSVQVLNEAASVAIRKMRFSLDELREFLGVVRALCEVVPLTVEIHDLGLSIAERYKYSLYHSIIIAAALTADCSILYSEDMHDGQEIDKRLLIRNPFRSPTV